MDFDNMLKRLPKLQGMKDAFIEGDIFQSERLMDPEHDLIKTKTKEQNMQEYIKRNEDSKSQIAADAVFKSGGRKLFFKRFFKTVFKKVIKPIHDFFNRKKKVAPIVFKRYVKPEPKRIVWKPAPVVQKKYVWGNHNWGKKVQYVTAKAYTPQNKAAPTPFFQKLTQSFK